jgi:hypothetical protein
MRQTCIEPVNNSKSQRARELLFADRAAILAELRSAREENAEHDRKNRVLVAEHVTLVDENRAQAAELAALRDHNARLVAALKLVYQANPFSNVWLRPEVNSFLHLPDPSPAPEPTEEGTDWQAFAQDYRER